MNKSGGQINKLKSRQIDKNEYMKVRHIDRHKEKQTDDRYIKVRRTDRLIEKQEERQVYECQSEKQLDKTADR